MMALMICIEFLFQLSAWSLLMTVNIKMLVKFGSVFQNVTINLHFFVGLITVSIM